MLTAVLDLAPAHMGRMVVALGAELIHLKLFGAKGSLVDASLVILHPASVSAMFSVGDLVLAT